MIKYLKLTSPISLTDIYSSEPTCGFVVALRKISGNLLKTILFPNNVSFSSYLLRARSKTRKPRKGFSKIFKSEFSILAWPLRASSKTRKSRKFLSRIFKSEFSILAVEQNRKLGITFPRFPSFPTFPSFRFATFSFSFLIFFLFYKSSLIFLH